jgi:hypothetical protein
MFLLWNRIVSLHCAGGVVLGDTVRWQKLSIKSLAPAIHRSLTNTITYIILDIYIKANDYYIV